MYRQGCGLLDEGSFPGRGNRFFIQSLQTDTGAQNNSFSMGTGRSFSGGEWSWLLASSSAEFKNVWSYTCTSSSTITSSCPCAFIERTGTNSFHVTLTQCMEYESVQGRSHLSVRKFQLYNLMDYIYIYYAPYRRLEGIQCCNILLSYNQ